MGAEAATNPDDIAVQYRGLARKVARRIVQRFGTGDVEEVCSECWYGVLLAARQYDPARGVPLKNWLAYVANHKGVQFLRKDVRSGVTQIPPRWRLNRAVGRPEWEDGADYVETIAAPESAECGTNEWWDEVTRGMIARRRECFLMHFRDGMTFPEIGERISRSRGLADQLVRSAMLWLERNRPDLMSELLA